MVFAEAEPLACFLVGSFTNRFTGHPPPLLPPRCPIALKPRHPQSPSTDLAAAAACEATSGGAGGLRESHPAAASAGRGLPDSDTSGTCDSLLLARVRGLRG